MKVANSALHRREGGDEVAAKDVAQFFGFLEQVHRLQQPRSALCRSQGHWA
jgi:hypothetical protein